MADSRKTVKAVLAAAVATAGTFTVAYPTGITAGNFKNGKRHRMVAMQSAFEAPKDFTISFGALVATITWLGATTIPAGSDVYVEMDMVGASFPDDVGVEGKLKHVDMFDAAFIDFGSPSASNDAYFRANATLLAGGAITLLQAAMPEDFLGRNLIFTSSADDTTKTWTITSKDIYGRTVVEAVTGVNNGVAAGKKAHYNNITVSASAAAAANLKIGYGDVLGLPVFIGDAGQIVGEFKNGAQLPKPPSLVSLPWFGNATDLSAGTAQQIVSPVAGIIDKIRTMVQVAIVTGGNVTMTNATVAVNGLSVAIANSATVGTAQTDDPTDGHATTIVAKGARLEVVLDAAFNGGGAISGFVDIKTTGLDGALVTGVTATPTSTTGDVRGTYDPDEACDGTTSFGLLVLLPDAGYRGSPQFAG